MKVEDLLNIMRQLTKRRMWNLINDGHPQIAKVLVIIKCTKKKVYLSESLFTKHFRRSISSLCISLFLAAHSFLSARILSTADKTSTFWEDLGWRRRGLAEAGVVGVAIFFGGSSLPDSSSLISQL